MSKRMWFLSGIVVLTIALFMVFLPGTRLQEPSVSSPDTAVAASTAAVSRLSSPIKGAAQPDRKPLQERISILRKTFSSHPRDIGTASSEPHTLHLQAGIIDTSVEPPFSGVVSGRAHPSLNKDTGLPQRMTDRSTLPFLVQFKGPILDDWKSAIAQAGGLLRGYIPNNALVVELNDAALNRIRTLDEVQWIGEYRADYKIQPFLDFLSEQLDDPSAAVSLTIQTFDPDDVNLVREQVEAFGGLVSDTTAARRWGHVRAQAPLETLPALASLGCVQWIEEYVPPTLFNDYAARGRHLNATNVWNVLGLTGYKQIVGHADTGLDLGSLTNMHPDLAGRIKNVFALGRPGDWSDPHSHGTHTAGSILGNGASSGGQFRGMAYEAQLVHQSIMDAGGGLGGLPDDLNDLFLQTYTNGARIHSDSWGSDVYGAYTLDSQYCDEFMWDYPDMLIIFSAGNEGIDANRDGVVDPDSMGSPATAKNLISVGAAENDREAGSGGYSSYTWGQAWPSDYPVDPLLNDLISRSADGIHQGMAAFSSRGPTDDGRFKPDLTAPGTDIVSCRTRAPGAGTGWGTHPNTNYLFMGGTSMATPLMAGVAALARQFYMERRGVVMPSAALIKAALINGARSLTPGQYGTNAVREIPALPRPNNVEGWGQPDLYETFAPTPPRRLSFIDSASLSTGETNTYRISLSGTNKAVFTLAWSDYPGTAGAGKQLVNDLDLSITAPNGTLYHPNGRTSPDRTNNVEGIDFGAPITGVYTVRIAAVNAPYGPQPYALVFTGGWNPLQHTPLSATTNTLDPYVVEAVITSLQAAESNTYYLFWAIDGSTRYTSNALTCIGGQTYRATIPAQPTGTVVSYYLQGRIDGQWVRSPTNAPETPYSFFVGPPVQLTVSGLPIAYGTATPDYGAHYYAVSNPVAAFVTPFSTPAAGVRYACTGWTGSGSVPAIGATNIITFTIETNSSLAWRWRAQYNLLQTSSVPGLLGDSEWFFSGVQSTRTASASVTQSATNYRFAYWTVDGNRRPNETNVAVNPAGTVTMTAPHTAIAHYYPSTQDSDADGLPDWWEYYYFGPAGTDPASDSDGDTYTNLQEYRDNTHPRNSASYPGRPVIAHTALATPQTTPPPWRVTAVVTDDCSIASVMLNWNRNGGGWQSITMRLSGVANTYTSAIPAPGTSGDSFAYFIAARDPAGLTATNGPYTINVTYPQINLSPSSIGNVYLLPGTSSNRSISVSNAGQDVLFWSLSVGYGQATSTSWLAVSPTNGTLNPTMAQTVVLELNASNLPVGHVRSALLIFRGNDPISPSNSIPLTISVTQAPVIQHTPPVNTTNTVDNYVIDSTITPTNLLKTDTLEVHWNTNGVPGVYSTGYIAKVSGNWFRGYIPARPVGTEIFYVLSASTLQGFTTLHPSNAPASMHHFKVVPSLQLTITGTPIETGTAIPDYGIHLWPSGNLVEASITPIVAIDDLSRSLCTGWLGAGSAPGSGSSTSLSFILNAPSTIDWQWATQFALVQSGSVAGLMSTTTWWVAGSTASTIEAASVLPLAATNHRFAGWYVDGDRQPDAINRAVNPATGLNMDTGQTAVALYIPEDRDTDEDGMPDWWEYFYFGTTGVAPEDDPDGDEYSNLQECLDETDPRDPSSIPSHPVITFTPLADPQTTPAPWPISADIQDNGHLAYATFLWSVNGGDWQSAAMTTGSAPTEFLSTLPAPVTNGDGVVYRIEARDRAGLTSVDGPHSAQTVYPRLMGSAHRFAANWLNPDATLIRHLSITNIGNTNLTWQLVLVSAGIEETVEQGIDGWTHGGDGDQWQISTNRYFSPTHAWHNGNALTRSYSDLADASLVSPSIRVADHATLTLQYWIDTEIDSTEPGVAYDGGIVEISTNDGSSYVQISPVGGYPYLAHGVYGSPFLPDTPCFAGTGSWESAAFDLGTYAGTAIRLRFRFGSDSSVAREGWYIDNIFITPCSPTNDWAEATPTNGSLSALESTNMAVTLNAAGLTNGDSRAAWVQLLSNDPILPTNSYRLSMYVGTPVTIVHSPLANTTNRIDDYPIEAEIIPNGPLSSNDLTVLLLWNTNGSATVFATNAMTGGSIRTGIIPAQPLGTEVSYSIRALLDAADAWDPADAPATLHQFTIAPPVSLTVTGVPAFYGTVTPEYGLHILGMGNEITAAATDSVVAGVWRACTGWTGSGSAPLSGNSNRCAFTIDVDSGIAWQWATRYLLTQTSTPAGIIATSQWYSAGSAAGTVIASAQAVVADQLYRFAEWRLDGVRQPDATSPAATNLTGISMTAPHSACAFYFPEGQDSDGDGLPDWWEQFYFGSETATPEGDVDIDGFSNAQEYGEATNPRDPASRPIPPDIQHIPLADPQTTAAPWQVTAVVTDNVGLARIPNPGHALSFNGVDSYAIANPVTHFPSSAITIEFWIHSSDTTNHGTPFSYATASDANEFTLYNYNTFYIHHGGVSVDTDVSVTDGAWHHIAVTWRQSDGAACLYKDGNLAWAGALATGIAIPDGGSLVFGNDQDSLGGGFTALDAVKGELDNMRLWNTVRTAQEIKAAMTNSLENTEPGLAGLWRFNDGSGFVLTDTTTNGNHLALEGPTWTESTAPIYAPDVSLWWRRNSNTWQKAVMFADLKHEFRAVIPGPYAPGDVFDYMIAARDAGGIAVTNGPYTFHVAVPEIALSPDTLEYVWVHPNSLTNILLSVSNAGNALLQWETTTAPIGFFDDMESDCPNWVHLGTLDLWHLSTNRWTSSTHAWHCGYDNGSSYANYMHCWAVTPSIELYRNARMSIRHWPDMESYVANYAWDGGIVEISTNDGLSFTQIMPISGYPFSIIGGYGQSLPGGTPCFAGQKSWREDTFDLSAYTNQVVQFRFRFGSDQQNDYFVEGWFLDDLLVTPQSGTNVWMTLSPTQGWVTAGTASNVMLSFDASDMTNGMSRVQKLAVYANDPIHPTNRVTVGLRAAGMPTIEHTPLGNTTNTVNPYSVQAAIQPSNTLNPDKLFCYWNTNGSGDFTAAPLTRLTGDLFEGFIPAQPTGVEVHYYVSATAGEEFTVTSPSNAPSTLHTFLVAHARQLLVTGTPTQAGTVLPDYGTQLYPSGQVIHAQADPGTPANGTRLACDGWVGTGSIPAVGTTNWLDFTLTENSVLDWQWTTQYALTQTGTPAGILSTTTWWFADATAQTVTAPDNAIVNEAGYHFAQWLLDTVRWPDASNRTYNPATGIIMTTSRTAVAVYMPTYQDSDGDDMADWWEYFFFGSLSAWRDDDADEDGFSNVWEFRDRTDPRDPLSMPAPPDIAHTPLADPQPGLPPWPISAIVTDNYQVAAVTLWWQRNAGDWSGLPMTDGESANEYTNSIPSPAANADTFAYRIEATDAAGWTVTNGPHAFNAIHPSVEFNPTGLLEIALLPGSASNVVLYIGNTGGTNLTWTLVRESVGFYDTMDSAINGWIHGGTNDQWHLSTNRWISATNAWRFGDSSSQTYADNANAWLLTPAIRLHPGASLTFRQWLASETKDAQYAYDGGVVEMSTNAGADFFSITPTGGYPWITFYSTGSPFPNETPCMAGTGGWQTMFFDLSDYAGGDVQLRFRFGSDSSKSAEGWYIDDVAVAPLTGTNAWLSMSATNGLLVPGAGTNLILGFDTGDMTVGDTRAVNLIVEANDPASPTNRILLVLRVISTPAVVWLTDARQTSLDGSGLAGISNSVYDADQDTCSLEVLFSTDGGQTWQSAWMQNADGSVGGVTVSNSSSRQIRNISTTSGGDAVTNRLSLIWNTTNAPAVALATGAVVRLRAWDGTSWSAPVTSQPFMIDNEAPSITGAVVVVEQNPCGPYIVTNTLSATWSGFDDGDGSGIAGYFYSLFNLERTTNGWPTIDTQGVLSNALYNQNNHFYVWAVDQRGNRGASARGTVLVLHPQGDWDLDGVDNVSEDIAGTAADNGQKFFYTHLSASATNRNLVVVRWIPATNRTYSLFQAGPVLDDQHYAWTPIPGVVYTITNGWATWIDTNGFGTGRYYHVAVERLP